MRFEARFLAVSLLLILVWPAAAQTITGAITGTVADPSGAVFPDIKITVTNAATNVASTTRTNASGVYHFPFLSIGEYTITAEAAGFKKIVLGPFRLEVNQTARMDVKMEIGQVTESVEIRDIAPVLQTESTLTGGTIGAAKLTELPLNGRNFATLTLIVPGTISTNPNNMTTSGRFQNQGSRPYVNGNREQTNNFLLDGIDVNDSIDNRIGYQPNVDAIEEVKVLTGNAPAEFGNAAGAIVNAQLKSGTNDFHGNLFEFLRNDQLDANGFFSNRSAVPRRAFRRNIFGGTFGGPIVRDKAFFFMDYEGTRQVASGPATASVALPEYRTGNLSRFSQVIKDPTTGLQFPGNIIPQSRIVNPVALALFGDPKLYPLPNNPGTGTLGVTSNYLGSSASSLKNDQADAKVDLRLSDKDNLSSRWSIGRYREGGSETVLPIIMTTGQEGPTTTAVTTWTRTISPNIVNELRAGYSRIVITDTALDPTGLLGPDGNQKLGIPGGQPIPGASAVVIGDGLTQIGSGAAIGDTVDNKYQLGNNLTIARGVHFFKMGGQAIRFHQNRYFAGNNGALGTFSYSGGKYTGSGYADFLLNLLTQKGRGSVTGKWGHRHTRGGIFFQDDWKVRQNLTLNLGLRWEYTQPVYEVADRQSNFDLVTGKQLFAGKGGNSRALIDAYYKQFMPRVGLAWVPGALKQKFVVRAGYAITSFLEGTGANLRLPMNPPFFFESDIVYDLSAPGDIRKGFVDVVPGVVPSGQVRAWDPHLRPQFTQQWNLTLEYQLSKTASITSAYVGQKGTHLVVPREGNQPVADPGPVSTWRPLQERRPLYAYAPLITNIATTAGDATMDYHALQLSGRKRMTHGVDFVTSYTFSKTITDNRGFYGGGTYIAGEGAYWQNAYDRNNDRGRAFYDASHNFNFGGTWELPLGKGRAYGNSWGRAVDMIAGGWSTNFMVLAHSGFPVTILGRDVSNQATRGNVRPNRYGALTYNDQTVDHWFGTGNTFCASGVNDGKCAYGDALTGQFGNSAIATEQSPSFFSFSSSVGKRFRVTEKTHFDLRAEFYNLLNHTSFGPPARATTSPGTFGQITSQTTPPRNIEFGLKFFF
ncbi:MAG TPA: TonB-dependent receptor [Bryobacteraceae bacterium]|nr:TonB-dependent receptor [Bryobacteraceae bacterium]